MDPIQIILNFVWGGFLTLGGLLAKNIYDRLKGHDDQFQEIPHTYARRDDVKERFQEIRETLGRIETKIDRKND